MRLFKVLNGDKAYHGGTGVWSLPHDGQPGEWMPPIVGDLVPCENGYHLCREDDLLEWLGPDIYDAEHRGEMVVSDNKVVVREARLLRHYDTWNERMARLFACDCAERVAHLGNEAVLRQTIAVARRYVNGEATGDELAAARAAGWAGRAAAGDAAWGGAWYAAWGGAWGAAGTAAWYAARAAAWGAAWYAAWGAGDAGWDAERQRQTARLLEYLDGKC